MPKQRETPPRNVGDVLIDRYVPSPLPPQAPDGGLVLTPPRSLPQLPAQLCEQGPCRYFHLARAQVDAQTPLDGSAPLFASTQKVMACYPSPGIELELTLDAPITACNRWDPMEPAEIQAREERRRMWGSEGQVDPAGSGELPDGAWDQDAERAWDGKLAASEEVIAEQEIVADNEVARSAEVRQAIDEHNAFITAELARDPHPSGCRCDWCPGQPHPSGCRCAVCPPVSTTH